MVWAKDLLPASWCGAEVLRDIVDGVPVSVAVVLGPVCVEVDGLHGPHEGVPHPHPVLHDHVQVLGRHHAVPDESPALVEESVLHPVEDEAGQLAGQGDGALAHLLHEGAGVGLHLLAGPGRGHQLHHGGVVGRVAGVRHDELRAVRHEVRYLARH